MTETDLIRPPTEAEVAEVLYILRPVPAAVLTIRRLAWQRDTLLSDRDRLRAALEQVEFCVDPERGTQYCHWCGYTTVYGEAIQASHAPDCPRQAALKGGDAQ